MQDNVIGIISLIFWALMIVVSLKYVTLILRADNNGEGGIMALLSLASSSVPQSSRSCAISCFSSVPSVPRYFMETGSLPQPSRY